MRQPSPCTRGFSPDPTWTTYSRSESTSLALGDRSLVVDTEDCQLTIEFEAAIIATGSSPMQLPGRETDGLRIIGSKEALSLPLLPKLLVVVGGGYIGLELGSVYAKLGISGGRGKRRGGREWRGPR